MKFQPKSSQILKLKRDAWLLCFTIHYRHRCVVGLFCFLAEPVIISTSFNLRVRFVICRLFVFLTRHVDDGLMWQLLVCLFFSLLVSFVLLALQFQIDPLLPSSSLYRRLSIRYSIVIIIYSYNIGKKCCLISTTDFNKKNKSIKDYNSQLPPS